MNRPAAEDDPVLVPSAEAEQLFGKLPVQMFQEGRQRSDRLQGEFWRVFLFGMLLFLMVEGALVLPPRTGGSNADRTAARKAPTTPTSEGANA